MGVLGPEDASAPGGDPAAAGRRLLDLLREPDESRAAVDLAAVASAMSTAVPPEGSARFRAARETVDRLCVDLVRHAARLERRAGHLALLGPACRDAGPREQGGGLGDLAEAARRSALEMAGTLQETVTVAVPRWKAGFGLLEAARDALGPEPGTDATDEARLRTVREHAAALRRETRDTAPAGADAVLAGMAALARGLRRLGSRKGGSQS